MFAGLVAGLLCVEAALRIAGFEFQIRPHMVSFGSTPIDDTGGFTSNDADLFWVPADYERRITAAREKRPELVFMGDSCTHQGRYPEFVTRRLNARVGRELRWSNLGAMGYTSFQGLRQLERDVAPLAPRVVTLFYGWNDHWIGFGLEDAQVAKVLRFDGTPFASWRLAQFIHKSTLAADPHLDDRPERVPLPDFKDNLRAMVRAVRDWGGTPLLITAPSAHGPDRTPDYLTERWLRDPADLIPLHQAYCRAVRDVASEENAALCDVAAHFDSIPLNIRAKQFFYSDGIHLNPNGDEVASELIDAYFRDHGLVDLLREH